MQNTKIIYSAFLYLLINTVLFFAVPSFHQAGQMCVIKIETKVKRMLLYGILYNIFYSNFLVSSLAYFLQVSSLESRDPFPEVMKSLIALRYQMNII